MVHCCVRGCKNRSEQKYENITFHTFPKYATLRKVWISATGRRNWEPTKYSRLCSIHFKDHCFRKTLYKVNLEKYSVPTLAIHDAPAGVVRLDQSLPSTSTKDHEPMTCQLKTGHNNAGETCLEPPNRKRKPFDNSENDENDSDIEDEYYVWAKECALGLKQMDPEQQIFAKSAITYILREGRLGLLNRNSVQVNNKVPDEQSTHDDCNDSQLEKLLVIHKSGPESRLGSASHKTTTTKMRSYSGKYKSFNKTGHSSPVTSCKTATSVNSSSYIVVSHKTTAAVDSSSLMKTKPCEYKGQRGSSSVVPQKELPILSDPLMVGPSPLFVKEEQCDDAEPRLNGREAPISLSPSLVKLESCEDTDLSLHDIVVPVDPLLSVVKLESCDDTESFSSASHGITVPLRKLLYYEINTSPSHSLVKSEPNSAPSSPGFTHVRDEPE